MKLIEFGNKEDFGDEWWVCILKGRDWTLFQGSVSWSVYGSGPYLQMSIGYGRLLSVIFTLGRFGFDFEVLGRNWGDYRDDLVGESDDRKE